MHQNLENLTPTNHNLSGGTFLLNVYGEWANYKAQGLPLKEYLQVRYRQVLATYISRRFGQAQARNDPYIYMYYCVRESKQLNGCFSLRWTQ